MIEIDPVAKTEVVEKWAMPASLHLPISARDKNSLFRFIGKLVRELSSANTDKAFLIRVPPPATINKKLAVWSIPESNALHQPLQVWVHVDYRNYRKAYISAFPEEDISSMVIDHVLNRRLAKIKGFNYVRLLPISRSANSSSGALSEQWGIKYHSSPRMRQINQEKGNYIQYADLSDLVKMLNLNTGGGVMDAVNDAQSLLRQQ
ncbi:MAG: hypothetical protein ACI8XU_002608 [Kiritimatiellia bacterium]|jgi:hypothetical protein